MIRIFVVLIALMFTGCGINQVKTTNIRESDASPLTSEQESAKVLSVNPVILDTRSPLDFGVSHRPGAISAPWTDFTEPGSLYKGKLDSDDFGLARRFALWGIDPARPVLVIGQGLKGHGEEGWVAWLLRLEGVKDVSTGTTTSYRTQIPRDEGLPENKPVWIPKPRESLRILPQDARKFLKGPSVSMEPMTGARSEALGGVPSAVLGQRRVVLDVRGEAQRKALSVRDFKWTGKIIEIEWKKFFDSEGRISKDAKAVAHEAGLQLNDEILVVSDIGLESGAVTYALEMNGFDSARNIVGGLRAIKATTK